MANQIFRPMVDWMVCHKRRIIQVGVGLALYELWVHLYDFVFFPFAIYHWGPLWGGTIAVVGAFANNILVYWLYDVMKVDWLQARAVRDMADSENNSRLTKLAKLLTSEKKGIWRKLASAGIFLGLTAWIDPVIVAVHFRKEHFKGISRWDWFLLLAASASGCVVWLLGSEFAVLILKKLSGL